MSDENPVLTQSAVVAAVSAVLIALVALGIINLTDTQMQAVVAAVGAVLVIVAPLAGALWAKPRTTPAAKPVDEDGTPLVRADTQQPSQRAAAAGRIVLVDGPAGTSVAEARAGTRGRLVWSK